MIEKWLCGHLERLTADLSQMLQCCFEQEGILWLDVAILREIPEIDKFDIEAVASISDRGAI